MESFLGSIWFGMMMCVVGYIVGHVFPISSLVNMFKK